MAPTKRYLALLVAITIPMVVFLSTEKGISDQNAIEVVCKVVPVSCGLENDSFRVPIWLANNLANDSVGGFELWINISHPNFIQFDVDSTWWLHDSHCIQEDEFENCLEWGYDSIQVSTTRFDSVNTISQGWEFLEARVLGGDGGVIKVSGAANLPAPPNVPSFPAGFDTLIFVYAHTVGVLGDSLCDSVQIEFRLNPSQTRFSDSESHLFGCDYTWTVDTFYFNCAQWEGDSCVAWFDTVLDSTYTCVIDPARILLITDTLELVCCDCQWIPGDANGDSVVNITDAVYLIQYIFNFGPAPVPVPDAGNMNCDDAANITDAVYIIQYIFAGGPGPACTCADLVCD
ncbi:MAG: dockerin type I repeat-containing protein [bacterium]